jgi:hypothetical protein
MVGLSLLELRRLTADLVGRYGMSPAAPAAGSGSGPRAIKEATLVHASLGERIEMARAGLRTIEPAEAN